MAWQDASAVQHRQSPERQIRELLTLYEIGQSLCSIHDLDLLLRFAMERVVVLLEVESSSIILLDKERQELYFKAADDIHDIGQKLQEIRFPAGQGIAGWVVREGNHPAVDTMTPRRGKDLGATGSLLPVPSRRTGDLFASGTLPTRENTKATCFRGWCQVRHNSL